MYADIGYSGTLQVVGELREQSSQLRRPIDLGFPGDQTVVYGFACNSDFNYLPFGVHVANALARAIDDLRMRTGRFLPDGKVLVAVDHDRIDTLALSVQHAEGADLEEIRAFVLSNAVEPVIAPESIGRIHFNEHSMFVSGGFESDTGLSGRKLACDTYGGLVPHGGGSFSGKDPSKVDRCGAYMARLVAKSLVAAEAVDACLVSIAYAFGVEDPVMVTVESGDTRRDGALLALINDRFDFRLDAIVDRLNLKRPIFRPTATYGHFSNPRYPWEEVVPV